MNTKTLRMKYGKKGVTPVIATIILIAGTLVLALVVGAYTFGLFGSNVKTVTLSSATLYGGTETTQVQHLASAD
ncbi:MAG: archaellin/type IV pilin N-terminal domain-containing protein [Nitrososphaerales archaeon]